MNPLYGAELVVLGAIWGSSFLFMRIAVPEFGVMALTEMRVAGATLLLLPLALWRRELGPWRAHWRSLVVVGMLNSAVPFALFALAALAIHASLAAIFNATAPLWGALIGWLWLRERLTAPRLAGLALGFAGVVYLSWNKASFAPGEHGVSSALAIGACLLAAACYGMAAHYTRRRLAGVPPMCVAAGSQAAAALALALPALWWAPASMPGAGAWTSAAVLALMCTGLAYLLYFHLLSKIGASRAINVTYLNPLFAALWGAVFLAEPVTGAMVLGCATILLGTALASGWLAWPRRSAA